MSSSLPGQGQCRRTTHRLRGTTRQLPALHGLAAQPGPGTVAVPNRPAIHFRGSL